MDTILAAPCRSLRADLIAITALVVVALLMIVGFFYQPRTFSATVDQASNTNDLIAPVQLHHFYGSEGVNQRYRWSDGQGLIALPNPGGSTIVRLRLSAGPTEPVALRINSLHTTIDVRLAPESRQYTFILPPQDTPRIVLDLSNTPRQISNDPRQLGVVLSNMTVFGGGTPPSLITLLIALAGAGCYITLRVVHQQLSTALLIASIWLIILIVGLATWGWSRPDICMAILYLMITLSAAIITLRCLTIVYTTSIAWPWLIPISLMIGLAVLPLVFYSATGTLTRYIADDYCYATPTRDLGPLGLVMHMYTTWSGRYTSTLLIGVLTTIGPASAPIMPTILIIVWLVGLSWALAEIGRLLGFRYTWIGAILIAAPTLTATLASTPNLFQSVYWQVGGQTYLSALIAATLYSGWLIRSLRRKARIFPAVLFSLVAGIITAGFSESNAALNLTALTFAMFGTLLLSGLDRSRAVRILGAGVIGTLIGLALVANAPGNQVRQSLLSTPQSPPMAIWSALQEALAVIRYPYNLITSVPLEAWIKSPFQIGRPLALIGTTIAIFVSAVISTLMARPNKSFTLRQAVVALISILLISSTLAAANLALGFYALGERPPDRVFLASYFLVALGLASLGVLCGCVLPIRLRSLLPALTLITNLALIATILGTAIDNAERRPRMQAYAIAWAQVDQQARSTTVQNEHRMIAPAAANQLDGLLWITSDSNHWSNICTAQYYRIDQIISASP